MADFEAKINQNQGKWRGGTGEERGDSSYQAYFAFVEAATVYDCIVYMLPQWRNKK